MAPSILLVKTGIPSDALRATAGDYDAWFEAAFGPGRVRLTSVAAYRGEELPAVAGFDAVLSSGSPQSVTERAPWMKPTGEYLLHAAAQGKAVLAVCFGHQLVAQVLGAKVELNPAGREIGTVEVRLTAEGQGDPLFAGVGAACSVQATHSDAVLEVPLGATVLAENRYGIQALAIGSRLRSVQFHPELNATRMRALIESRHEALAAEGLLESARASVRDTPAGSTILERFLGWI